MSAPTFDKDPPVLPAGLKPGGVLIFSRPMDFVTMLRSGVNAAPCGDRARAGVAVLYYGERCGHEPGAVSKFKVVVWNSTSGDTLTADQRAAFKSWMENGGSFVGTHGSGGDPVFSGGPHFGPADWRSGM